jgi:hypothetical protein
MSESNVPISKIHHTIVHESGSILDKSIDPAFDNGMMNMSHCYNNFGG